MNKKLLTRPFEPHQIKQRPGHHGKTLSYVDVAAVISRLNEGCDTWSFEVVSHDIHGDEVVVLGKLTADGMTKMAFGGSSVTIDKSGQVVSVADDLKAAASDALKKAASLLGVGLELYGGNGNGGHPESGSNGKQQLPSLSDRLTSRQLAAIHSVSRRNGLSKDGLTAVVMKAVGKSNPAELSKTEASMIISELTGTNGGGR